MRSKQDVTVFVVTPNVMFYFNTTDDHNKSGFVQIHYSHKMFFWANEIDKTGNVWRFLEVTMICLAIHALGDVMFSNLAMPRPSTS